MKNKYQYAGNSSGPGSGVSRNRKRILLCRHISWGAIFAGTLIALISMMILHLLGIGFGLGIDSPSEGSNLLSGLSTGAIVWWVVSNLIAIFAGSFTASRLASAPFGFASTLHGVLSWCLYTLTFFWILTTSLGGLISGVGSVLTGTLSAAVYQTALLPENPSSQENMISMHKVDREIKQILRDNEDPTTATDSIMTVADTVPDHYNLQQNRENLSNDELMPEEEIKEIAREVLYDEEGFAEQIDRQDIANIIQDRTFLDASASRDVADIIIRQYRKAKRNASQQEQEARHLAEANHQEVKEAASTAAVWISASLLLGMVVAGLGGRTGKPFTPPEPGNEVREQEGKNN